MKPKPASKQILVVKANRLWLSCLLLCSASILLGQQSPTWSSFYENGFIWNPALTAKWNSWELSATNRQEWSGFENAPKYQTLGFQYPFIKRKVKVTVGAFVDQDKVGPYESLGAGLTYAYKIYPNLFGNRKGVFTFGLTAKMNQFRFNQSSLIGYDGLEQENLLPEDQDNFTNPNVNVGVFYISVSDFYAHEPHYYFGASINNLIPLRNELGNNAGWRHVPHINLHGGLRLKPGLRSNYYWEPSIMVSIVNASTINIMAHMRYEKEQKYWAALGAVSNGEVFGQVGIIFNDQSILGWLVNDGWLRIGTKVDYSVGSLGQFTGMGYEAYIAYVFSEEGY